MRFVIELAARLQGGTATAKDVRVHHLRGVKNRNSPSPGEFNLRSSGFR